MMSSCRQLSPFIRVRSLKQKSTVPICCHLQVNNLIRQSPCPRLLHLSPVLGDVRRVKMPSLSPTMTEGTIVKWLKKEGDRISPGDLICDIQTDKAAIGFELEEEGILAKIMVPDQSGNIQIGTLIAVIVDDEDELSTLDLSKISGDEVVEYRDHMDKTQPAHSSQVAMGPAVRQLLQQYHLNTYDITSSGPKGYLLKGDIIKHITSHHLQPVEQDNGESDRHEEHTVPPTPSAVPPSPSVMESGALYIDDSISGMRKTIAKRLTLSKTTIPHGYVTVDCHVDKIMCVRNKLKEGGNRVSLNDFIIKCAGLALLQVQVVNSIWDNDELRPLPSIDISVAVATPSGLITPIIRNVDKLGVTEISSTVRDLAHKARESKLKPEEYQGGSFTISNLGMFGITEFSAVINPPQVGILALGSTRQLAQDIGSITHQLSATLSYNAQAITQSEAGQWLYAFRSFMENPDLMLAGHAALSGNQVHAPGLV